MRRYRITTPEQVTFRYTVAGVVGRCMAWLVDQAIIWLGYIVIVFLFAQLGNGIGIALIILGWFILDFSYFVSFELYSRGQSPGKRLFKIRVIAARGNKLTFTDVLVRNTMRPLDMLPIAMVVGGVTATIDKWHRRLGDIVADTIVIRDIRNTLPAALAAEKNRVNSFSGDATMRSRIVTRVSREERDVILDLVLRREQIEAGVREELFTQTAAHLRSRLSLPPEADYLSDEQTVVNVALVIQDSDFTA